MDQKPNPPSTAQSSTKPMDRFERDALQRLLAPQFAELTNFLADLANKLSDCNSELVRLRSGYHASEELTQSVHELTLRVRSLEKASTRNPQVMNIPSSGPSAPPESGGHETD